jgi:predicted membrane-bound spermidine synthase
MNDPRKYGRGIFFAVFTVSGFSGLIYESIWSHYLKLFLGHAAYAQTLVLAIFMGGMALGSWLMARYSLRIRNLLLGYVLVEGVIGLMGLGFHRVYVSSTAWAFDSLIPALDSPALAQLAKWTLGSLLILPQSILLGTTFPLMSGAIVRRFPERAGETLAMLYFTNSLGAALGVLISGFVLIQATGLPGTILTAGLLNVALALFVWMVGKQESQVPETPAAPAPTNGTPASVALRWIAIGAGVTGAAAFLYEIAWIRMLSLVLGSSTHSFELMLSAFILGIALGGVWVRKRIDQLADPVRFLGTILTIMACVALASLPLYNATFDLMGGAVKMFSPTEQGYLGFNLASHAIAMLLMIPTTFFCGMTLPVMTHVLIRGGQGEKAIGSIYAWNTAGAIVGVIGAVHVLMPTIGVKGIVITGAALHLALGLLYAAKSAPSERRAAAFAVPAGVGTAALVIAIFFTTLDPMKLASGVFRHGMARHQAGTQVLWLEHGKTATVSLVDVAGRVSIATNGKPDAALNMRAPGAAPDEITMVMAGALPLALHSHPARVANIGMGSGLTSHVLLASDEVKSLDTVEIEPYMAKAAEIGFMPRVQRTFRDPRSHIHFEDAKTFFAVNHSKYDLIISEPSNPWVSGVSTLFSSEFYGQINRYLEPDGLLVQWFQIYETDIDVLFSVIKALEPQFEDFAIYNADDEDLLIVARPKGRLPALSAQVFDSPALRAELERVGITSLQHIRGRYLGDKALLQPLLRTARAPANSDFFPYVDLNAPRARILQRNAIELPLIETLPIPFFEMLGRAPDSREHSVPSLVSSGSRDDLLLQATVIRDALLDSSYESLAPGAAATILTLQSSPSECTQAGVRRAWLNAATFVAQHTSNVLAVAELGAMWDKIAATPCVNALATDEREYLGLLRAVSQRDTAAAAKAGLSLFKSDHVFGSNDQLVFALLATSAATAHQNQPAETVKLIDEVSPRIQASREARLALRWIDAIAAQMLAASSSAAAVASNTAPTAPVGSAPQ